MSDRPASQQGASSAPRSGRVSIVYVCSSACPKGTQLPHPALQGYAISALSRSVKPRRLSVWLAPSFSKPPRPGRCTFERFISDPDERLRLTVYVVLVRQPPKGHPLPHPFGASPSTRCRAPSPTATRSFCRSLHAAPRGFPPPPSARVAPASRFRAFNQHAATDPAQALRHCSSRSGSLHRSSVTVRRRCRRELKAMPVTQTRPAPNLVPPCPARFALPLSQQSCYVRQH